MWRITHQKEFIQTILLGYPFPQVFIARGGIDVEKMEAKSCIVDGQQRMNSIQEFVDDEFDVGGRFFSQLSAEEKSEFLKYEVPIIDLDMEQSDRRIIDIFARLNRTNYALSGIEKQSTEYGATEFMLVAKLLSGELNIGNAELSESLDDLNIDPNVSPDFLTWAVGKIDNKFRELVVNERIFTPYEISRKVQLQFTLNVMSTFLRGNFNRNDMSRQLLEEYSQSFSDRDMVFSNLTATAEFVTKMRLPERSIWWRKANIFTLLNVLSRHTAELESPHSFRVKLDAAGEALPPEYILAAREAVNNRKERTIRDSIVENFLFESSPTESAV